ncbi:hypothetical protein [Nonomuraea turcica]|uniref:hypothetical protein n=1 Tax=Nonomuraea sp. G32 TaxID=3067274 RepID=UPI00273CCACB|nr:hypothetical protein [Nonomuraea sp. G32]MDP4509321.1 hypothetical protein [Nonomuraea sp. G32]
MNVVDVIAVRHGHVPALGPVLVVMRIVRDVRLRLTLVHMILMDAVQATVVDIVDMLAMRDGHMAAAESVLVSVLDVLAVFGSH